MKQMLRALILVVVSMLAFSHLAAQQQTRSSANLGIPGTTGYAAQQQARGPGNPTPQNGNGSLGQVYNFSKCGLNFTQASQRLGQRFSPAGVPQPAAFAISGIPACAVIEQAFLWAEGSGDGSAQTATIINPATATQNFPMALVGSGPDKCWGYSGSHTYRADVTPVISGNGNYIISGLLTNPPTSGNDMDGATLMIIYSDPTAAFTGSMLIHDGTVVVPGGITTQTITGMNVCQNVAAANATAFCVIADLQVTGPTCIMNGTNAPLTWNWWNYVSVNTALTAGQTTSACTVTSAGDCFNLCMMGVYYQTTCTPCTVSSLTLTPSSTPATCSNCNGTASVSVAPAGIYNYSWAPSGGNAATATGLCAGTYTVTVSNTCNTATMAVTVASAGGALTVNNAGQTNVNCFGNCTGTASVTVSGGTGPYTYAWTPSGGSAPGATGLCAGTYTCTVTDANGCTGTRTFSITQPAALTNTFSQVNVLCNGGNNGSATVTAAGGTPGYTFSWAPAVTNSTSGSSNTATGLAAGTYVCTVTDLNGCTSTRTVVITQPPALNLSANATATTCGLNNGSVTATATGGSGTITYLWTPGNFTTATVNNLASGTYVVTITDGNNCIATATTTINGSSSVTSTNAVTNVLCNGGATGSATVTVTGNNGPVTYAWVPNVSTTNIATGLTAGTYTCTATDATGCPTTTTVTITQPTALTNTFTQLDVLCNGGNNGSATVTAAGGTPGYTFSWAPAVANSTSGSSNTATGLTAGTYTCTITDLNGCTSSRTVVITQPPALNLSANATATTCGLNNGSVTATATGGSGTITYLWTPGNFTTATVNNLASGTYVVTVTDGNNCTATATTTVNSSSSIASTNAVTNVLCNGGATGSATVTVTGNNGLVTYAWIPNVSTTNIATGLTAGTYTCTATDATGCPTTTTVTITQPPALTNTFTQLDVLCNGGNNGSATITAAGGTPGYTFSWAPAVANSTSGSSNTATGLTAGTYVCTVTDLNGCTSSQTITITQPPVLNLSASATATTCGLNNGSVTATATGGSGTITYLWTPGNFTTATVNNLASGTYVVTITDGNNCIATATTTINGSSSVTSTNAVTNVLCNGGATGSATVTVTGNNGPVTYAWVPNVSTTNIATGLTAGTYVCTATDATGCPTTTTITITQPAALTNTFTQLDVLCNGGNNGSATVTAAGGTPGYTFSWAPAVANSTSGNSNTATGLAAGTYVCTITDLNGCTSSQTITITQPPALNLSASATATTCGLNNGSVTATATGGSGTITYLWTPGNFTTATVNNLASGTYVVTITDGNNCTATATTTVNSSSSIASTNVVTNVLCNGGATGSATVTVTGNNGPVTYAWVPNVSTTNIATGLTAGTYTCTATDATGCPTTTTVIITQPTILSNTFIQTDVLCNGGNTGTATITAAGGTPGYTFTWTPAVTNTTSGSSNTATGLAAGTYVCTITDLNGCISSQTITITQPPALNLSANATATTCGLNNGSMTATATGGSGTISYFWTPGNFTTATVNNLASGTYVVTITDGNNCTATATTTVNSSSSIASTNAVTNVLCNGGATGSATVTVTGNNGPVTYAWVPNVSTTNIATGLTAGTYTCTATDATGCPTTTTVIITQPTALTNTFSQVNVLCNGGNTGTATITAAGGTPGYTFSWAPAVANSTSGNSNTATGLAAGTYVCTVTDLNGCTSTRNVVITQPPALNLSASATATTCGLNNGSVTASATGGSGTITYLWTPGNFTTATVNNLASGTYVVTITDGNNCTATATTTVNSSSSIASTNAVNNVLCNGGATGSATVTVTGNNGPVTYAWVPNVSTTNIATGLTAGTYVCTATDATGCTSTVTLTVTQPAQLTTTAAANPTAVCQGQSVNLSASPFGGIPGYTGVWTPGNLNGLQQTVVPTATTTYTLTVTDLNGCTAAALTTVTVNQQPAPQFTASPTQGCAPHCVNFTDQTGAGSWTWNWDFGDGNSGNGAAPSNCYNLPGSYDVQLTVTDATTGCTNTVLYTNFINVFANPVAAFGLLPDDATMANPTIFFTDSSSAATSWNWSFGDPLNSSSTLQNPSFTYPGAGCYEVVLIAASINGCVSAASDSVCIDTETTFYAPNAFTPNGDGLNDVFMPIGIGIKTVEFHLYIFDRWGNEIFYSKDPTNGWDGRANNGTAFVQNDTYTWYVSYVELSGRERTKVGIVTLIR